MDNEYNEIDEEEFAALEDRPGEETFDDSVIVQPASAELEPDTPVYRLRLSYSNETFLAAYKGEVLEPGGKVLVPTRYGRDLAQVMGRVSCSAPEIALIERPATEEDLHKAEFNKNQEKEAFEICREKIEKHRLEMKLVSVHYLLDEPKILFFFTAENRVDFRELVK
ncbi:MAG: hypothetical protein LBG26_05565, partial [Treponema sp.]|nr:hypothetical protein [Treponema sp.]